MSRLNTFLSGIRVIDLSRHLPGPLATLLLADMGAEVLKIEPPGGDDLRTMGPCGPRGHSVYFDAVNAGKTTRRMNLKDPDARAALLRLVETADVLVESFRPDVMARLELDYETVKPRNPGRWKQIHATIAGTTPAGYLGCAAAILNFDFTPKLPSLKVPALVVCGAMDEGTPPAGNKKIAELVPGARYEEIANARHFPNVERAEAFNKIMLGWLASHR